MNLGCGLEFMYHDMTESSVERFRSLMDKLDIDVRLVRNQSGVEGLVPIFVKGNAKYMPTNWVVGPYYEGDFVEYDFSRLGSEYSVFENRCGTSSVVSYNVLHEEVDSFLFLAAGRD